MAVQNTLPSGKLVQTNSVANIKPPRTLWGDAWRQFQRHKLAMLGTAVVSIVVLFVILGPFLWSINPRKIDFSATMVGPNLSHPFGTDLMGHDLMSRAMWGGRISILVGFLAMVVSITFGTLIGALSGFFGGFVDALLMRFTELCIALPRLPLLMIVIYLFRDSTRQILGPEGRDIVSDRYYDWSVRLDVYRTCRSSFLSLGKGKRVRRGRHLHRQQQNQADLSSHYAQYLKPRHCFRYAGYWLGHHDRILAFIPRSGLST